MILHIVTPLFALWVSANAAGVFADEPTTGIPFNHDELIELLHQIDDGEWDDDQLAEIMPRLMLSCRPDETQSMGLHVLSTLYERNSKIVRPHLPSFAPLIAATRRERELCRLCEFLWKIDDLPPEVVASLAKRFAERDEDDDFANGMMAALLLMDAPDNVEIRTWLEQEMEHKDKHNRVGALNAISYAGDAGKPSLPVIKKRLNDESPAVRVAAAVAVQKIAGDADATVPVLLAALNVKGEIYLTRPFYISEWFPDHRIVAIGALGKFTDRKERIALMLLHLLNDEDVAVQYATLRSLANLNDRSPEVIAAVREKLNEKDGIAGEAKTTHRKLTSDDEQ